VTSSAKFQASFPLLLTGLSMIFLSEATSQQLDPAKAEGSALVTWSDAGAPLGKFLLVRKGIEVCAVRFTAHNRERDAKGQTPFSSGEESFSASYEWFYQGDGSQSFSKQNVKSGRGKVSKGPLRGIGRLAFETSDSSVRCGPLRLGWMYPTRVTFYEGGRLQRHDIELAPTNWESIDQVRVNEKRLQWFKYDEKREITYIPSDKL